MLSLPFKLHSYDCRSREESCATHRTNAQLMLADSHRCALLFLHIGFTCSYRCVHAALLADWRCACCVETSAAGRLVRLEVQFRLTF